MGPGGRTTVLVIGHDSVIDDLYSAELVEAGYLPLRAEDGSTGLRIATQGGIDVVLLNADLPDSSSLHVLRTLKACVADAVIFVLANCSQLEDRLAAREVGVDAWLVKSSTSPRLLRESIELALLRRERRLGG